MSETPAGNGIKANVFRDEAGRLIHDVRRTLLAVLESGGKQIAKSDDAQKIYGIDSSLSWQLFKLSNEADILGAAQFIPPRVSIQKIFGIARRKAVPGDVIVTAETAFDRFENFMEIHAGDRAQFHSMVLSLSSPAKAKAAAAEQHRKASYKSDVFYWGVQLETSHLVAAMGPPTGDGSTSDALFVHSQLNFRCLRPSTGVRVAGFNMSRDINIQPLDKEAMEKHGAHVLPQFSEKALPRLIAQSDGSGVGRILFAGEEIGLTSGVDMTFAYVHRGSPRDMSTPRSLSLAAGNPTQQVFQEIFLHNSFPKMTPTVKMFGHAQLAEGSQSWSDSINELPCFEEAVHDRSVDDTRLLGVPRRREILTYCFEKMGWDIREFQVYRTQIAYPLLDTALFLTLDRADAVAS